MGPLCTCGKNTYLHYIILLPNMIRKIIEYSIKHKLMVALLVVTIIIGGLWAMKTISVDSTPDITNNQVQVITVAQNLSTTDIEQFIYYKTQNNQILIFHVLLDFQGQYGHLSSPPARAGKVKHRQ